MRTSETQPAAPEARSRQDDAETFEVQQWRAMEQPKWNEARLDDLSKRVDDGIGRLDEERKELRKEVKEGFEMVDEEFKTIRSEMKTGFEKVDEEFKTVRSEMKTGFEKVGDELEGLHRLMAYGAITMSGTMVVGFAAIVVKL